MTPPFDPESGDLPPGIHEATWDEFAGRYGYTEHRRRLLAGLRQALAALARAGCRRVYIDGSFVTAKLEPEDFDACWERQGVSVRQLAESAPSLIDFRDRRSTQKIQFGGELFPADITADGLGTRYIDFFQRNHVSGGQKGMIAIDPGAIP